MKSIILVLFGIVSLLPYLQGKRVDIDFGNGCKLVYISENNETKEVTCLYEIEYSIDPWKSLGAYKKHLRQSVLLMLKSSDGWELFQESLKKGYNYRYIYRSSKQNPDSNWGIAFMIDEKSL